MVSDPARLAAAAAAEGGRLSECCFNRSTALPDTAGAAGMLALLISSASSMLITSACVAP